MSSNNNNNNNNNQQNNKPMDNVDIKEHEWKSSLMKTIQTVKSVLRKRSSRNPTFNGKEQKVYAMFSACSNGQISRLSHILTPIVSLSKDKISMNEKDIDLFSCSNTSKKYLFKTILLSLFAVRTQYGLTYTTKIDLGQYSNDGCLMQGPPTDSTTPVRSRTSGSRSNRNMRSNTRLNRSGANRNRRNSSIRSNRSNRSNRSIRNNVSYRSTENTRRVRDRDGTPKTITTKEEVIKTPLKSVKQRQIKIQKGNVIHTDTLSQTKALGLNFFSYQSQVKRVEGINIQQRGTQAQNKHQNRLRPQIEENIGQENRTPETPPSMSSGPSTPESSESSKSSSSSYSSSSVPSTTSESSGPSTESD